MLFSSGMHSVRAGQQNDAPVMLQAVLPTSLQVFVPAAEVEANWRGTRMLRGTGTALAVRRMAEACVVDVVRMNESSTMKAMDDLNECIE